MLGHGHALAAWHRPLAGSLTDPVEKGDPAKWIAPDPTYRAAAQARLESLGPWKRKTAHSHTASLHTWCSTSVDERQLLQQRCGKRDDVKQRRGPSAGALLPSLNSKEYIMATD